MSKQECAVTEASGSISYDPNRDEVVVMVRIPCLGRPHQPMQDAANDAVMPLIDAVRAVPMI